MCILLTVQLFGSSFTCVWALILESYTRIMHNIMTIELNRLFLISLYYGLGNDWLGQKDTYVFYATLHSISGYYDKRTTPLLTNTNQ